MRIDRRAFIAVTLTALTALAAVSLLIVLGLIHYTEDLSVEEFRKLGDGIYSADIIDRYGVSVAKIHVQLTPQPSPKEETPLSVSILHTEDTEIDSIRLVLSGQDSPINVFLCAPASPWPEFTFHRSSDGMGATLEVEDLSLYGKGTINIDFILSQTVGQTLKIELNLSMHRERGIPLTIYKATASGSFQTQSEKQVLCPADGSPYVYTPIGTKSENFLWRCLQCGHTWRETYPEDIYKSWRVTFLDPTFVRDYTILYLREVEGEDLPNPLKIEWAGGRETPTGILGSETHTYRSEGLIISIRYPVVLPENTVYDVRVEDRGELIWEGILYQRRFIKASATTPDKFLYEYYGGVSLFKEGIYIIATDSDPTNLLKTPDFSWETLKGHATLVASTSDYISILISRGDHPTGGYTIQLKTFERIEGYPTLLYFTANFMDPGEGVIVTEAFTNPLVLIPIGNLPSGEYMVEVHVDRFVLTYDESGKPLYTPVETTIEEVWRQSFHVDAE